ncbi:protein-disulfide reductase DsbD family protein [Pararhodospirillum photometricum]|uniref:protein-disulfide reductase DsbD family protein n=1 Tax=Pararhodospirillum photometricum TaxID=1084 RepID=UPI0002E6D534|nr:thioredoxin family protein [Pararhodospirillum photometricum]
MSITADPPVEAPDLFLEPPAGLSFARPEVRLEEGGRRAILRARPSAGHVPSHGSLGALVADGSRGVELSVDTSVRLAPPSGLPFAGTVPLWASMALLAWLGGLILNLMPCVLPVLSLKVLGVLGHAGGTGQGARLSFLASSAGILTSFLVLAGAAIGLKAAGAVVGWGIQFQQPVFLAAMAAILTLFAANLWSVFEIPLPGVLASLGGRTGQGSPAGAFATGAFATVLATPCSAPFLGTAVGFALSGGPWETLGVFALLGLGMATPYLLLAAWPGFVRFLPRPGRWMLRLKAFLGLALAGTAAWLLQVLSAQTSPSLAMAVAGVLGLVLALLLAGTRWPAFKRAALGLAVGVGLAAPALPLILTTDPPSTPRADGLWRPWSPEAVNALVAEGKVVLVDVTAQWCTTCQVNKIGVLDRGRVAAALTEGRLIGLVADWTRPDPAIAAYLASFGRYGIPFAAVYGPGAPQGIPLPDLLSEQAVLDAMERAVR